MATATLRPMTVNVTVSGPEVFTHEYAARFGQGDVIEFMRARGIDLKSQRAFAVEFDLAGFTVRRYRCNSKGEIVLEDGDVVEERDRYRYSWYPPVRKGHP